MLTTENVQVAQQLNGNLARVLSTFKGRDIVTLLNIGNRGDGLIHMGGRRLFNSLGLRWREVNERHVTSDLAGDVLFVYGCGAFGHGTHTLADIVPDLSRRFQKTVILPATFDVSAGKVLRFARTWGDRYTIFCREMISFDSLREAGARPGALLLCHDLAFHADLSEWAARPHGGRAGIFRRDNEASTGRLPTGMETMDASRGTELEPEKLLDYVARFSEIHTDRCHGAIAAAMMGRRVFFYPNSYFKNQAIYEHSLSRYPTVRFMKEQPFSFRQFTRAMYWGRLRSVEMKARTLLGQGSRKR